jgi:hypothetical protein
MRFAPATLASAGLVLAGPLIGQIRGAFLARFPDSYRPVLLGVVLVALAMTLITAAIRIRTKRVVRFGLIALAVTIGVGYAWISRTGNPSIDAVERFHFVQYGVITFLFYRTWRHVPDASRFVLSVLAALIVSVCEEWFQWFVPARVGELHDVLLNLWAIICGLLFSVAIAPPAASAARLGPESAARVRKLVAVTVLVFAGFFHCAHLGYRIDDPGATFFSTYSAAELGELTKQREQRWRQAPPLTWGRYSREDQYFSEGVALVQARNRCWDAGDVACAWRNNFVAERYYAPVLDTPSYVSASGLRWPLEQRGEAERRAQSAAPSGEVDASVIYPWDKAVFWTVVGIAVLGLLAWPRMFHCRS